MLANRRHRFLLPFRLCGLFGAVAIGVGVFAGTVDAAVTVGPDVNATPAGGSGCYAGPGTPPVTWSNSALDGGALVTSPIDGVVVRWRVKDYTGPGDLLRPTFRVLRASGAGFTGAGSAGPVPGYHGLGQFAARLPIREGDRIGIDTPCAPQNYVGAISGGSYQQWSPPLADGETPGRPPSFTNSSNTLLINADVEADADRDGFGDETQDMCPGSGGPSEGCPPAPPKSADVTSPSVLSFAFDHSTIRAAGKGGSIARAAVGTRVRYRLSEASSAKFRIERASRGRKRGAKCVRPNRRNRRKRRCTRYRRLKGSFSHKGTSGFNSFRFTGRLRGRKLRPGRYRLVMVVTDAAGNKSTPSRAKFRVVRR